MKKFTSAMALLGAFAIAVATAFPSSASQAASGPAAEAYEGVVAAVGRQDAAAAAAFFAEDARLVGGLACDPCLGRSEIQRDMQARIDAGLAGTILSETALADGRLEATLEARGSLVAAGGAERLLLKHTITVDTAGLIVEFVDEFVEGDAQNETFIKTLGLGHPDDLPVAGYGYGGTSAAIDWVLLLSLATSGVILSGIGTWTGTRSKPARTDGEKR